MNSLVDPYKHRYFDPRRGQVIGVNYGLSGQAIESELGLGSGKRIAGEALGLDALTLAQLLFRPGIDKVEIEKGPYDFEKDPPVIEKLPYFPGGDEVAGFQMPADLSYPRGRRGDNFEGVPNANDPVMREKLRNRRLRNPAGGEDLPGFLGRV
tara:strand:+ start:96 stop:554 length:459 start_codon:yes stop_codon:yes gene_type:complete